MKKISLLLTIALLTFSCGDDNTTKEGDTSAVEKTVKETIKAKEDKIEIEKEKATPISDGKLELEGNDLMQFNKNEFIVKEGQEITLTFKHVGEIPKTAMGHNFVLLKAGVDHKKFAKEAIDAKDQDYIPNNGKDVIAHTKMLGGGEQDVITFIAPAKGTYTFLCSFPGHFGMMNGEFIVE